MDQLIIPGSDLYEELSYKVHEQRSSFGEISVDEILIAAAMAINNPEFKTGYWFTLADHQQYFFDLLVGYARVQLCNYLERVLGEVIDNTGQYVRILDMYYDKSLHVMLAHPAIEDIDQLGREFHAQQEIRQALRL